MPDAKQKTSKLADSLASASIFKSRDGIAVVVVNPFMALLSFRGIDTPSLPAQGEQRRPSLFNIRRDNPRSGRCSPLEKRAPPLYRNPQSVHAKAALTINGGGTGDAAAMVAVPICSP